MRRLLTLLTFSALFSALALAETWSGTLLDAKCFDRQNQQLQDGQKAADACASTSETNAFALYVSGKLLKFDATGNSKTMTAMKTRSDKASEGATQSTQITAKVEGPESGGTISVDNIELQ